MTGAPDDPEDDSAEDDLQSTDGRVEADEESTRTDDTSEEGIFPEDHLDLDDDSPADDDASRDDTPEEGIFPEDYLSPTGSISTDDESTTRDEPSAGDDDGPAAGDVPPAESESPSARNSRSEEGIFPEDHLEIDSFEAPEDHDAAADADSAPAEDAESTPDEPEPESTPDEPGPVEESAAEAHEPSVEGPEPVQDPNHQGEAVDEAMLTDGAANVSARTDLWPDLTPAIERVVPATEGVSDAVASAGSEAAVTGEDEFPVVPEDAETPPGEEPFVGPQGAPDDEELPLADHIEEMVFRAAVVVAVAGAVSVLLYPFGDTLIQIIWNHVLPNGQSVRPHLYAPLDLVITQFKVASLAGIVAALPVLVYETYAFMRPGLYPNERRYYLAAIPTSLVLAVIGVLFAFFIVLPATFGYLVGYSNYVATSALALTSTFDLILVVMGYLALVFQLPLFMMLAVMMNLTTRQWLEDRRLLFWGAFAGLSFMFTSVDVSGVTPVLVAITMILLFEGTLLLLRWTGR